MSTELARVGDRIEHGQPIPGNVVRMTDAGSFHMDTEPWHWFRRDGGWRMGTSEWDPSLGPVRALEQLRGTFFSRWPMTVVEVDPEPQPAEPVDLLDLVRQYGHEGHKSGFAAAERDEDTDDHHDGKARRLYDRIEAEVKRLTPDPSQPVVLRLDDEPVGAVAVVGVKSGTRWERTPVNGGRWQNVATLIVRDWTGVLEREREVTVESAPPREPRTWPKIEVAPDGEPGLMVEVEGYGRFARNSFGNWVNDDHSAPTFHALRELGDVTEVIEP